MIFSVKCDTILKSTKDGGLAQLVRVPAWRAGGHWFDSNSLHHYVKLGTTFLWYSAWHNLIWLSSPQGKEIPNPTVSVNLELILVWCWFCTPFSVSFFFMLYPGGDPRGHEVALLHSTDQSDTYLSSWLKSCQLQLSSLSFFRSYLGFYPLYTAVPVQGVLARFAAPKR